MFHINLNLQNEEGRKTKKHILGPQFVLFNINAKKPLLENWLSISGINICLNIVMSD